ncbi:lysosome-associated membrane glycoprotein 5 [Nephila pilipes]|uniref:Lysosome-associated membrane glycoprotein 5 n=1 Tax=Nephila pilipes TaxID=299642 RepID=A0A8X6PLN9_NEPPI|nr:lysosome-associated membrane glycoprotein 5 [Nephila pilipes]
MEIASLAQVIVVLLMVPKFCSSDSASEEAAPTPANPPVTEHYLAPTDDVLARDVAPDFTFAVWDTNGKICILAKFSASFKITYPSLGGEQHISVNVPEDAKVKGRCGTFEKEPLLELFWTGFRLFMAFTVVNPKENQDTWELLSMELRYDTTNPLFDGATNVGKKTVRTLEDGLFATQYGKSYFCPSPDVIPIWASSLPFKGAALSESAGCPSPLLRMRQCLLPWAARWPSWRCSWSSGTRSGGIWQPGKQTTTTWNNTPLYKRKLKGIPDR